MKRLIVFKGGVETLEYFTEQMVPVWETMGYEIYWYNLIYEELSFNELRCLYEENSQDDYYCFTFNFEGIAGEAGLFDEETGFNFWDEIKAKVVNVVVDHPLYYHKYIPRLPKDYKQFCIDKVHVDYMNRFFLHIETHLLYSAGTELNRERQYLPDLVYLPMSERTYDIVFTGNFTPKAMLRKHLSGMDQEYIDFYEAILEKLIDNPDMTIDAAAEYALKQEFQDITDDQIRECMPTMMYVDLAVRFHYRELAIKLLAENGIKVHVFGEGYEYMNITNKDNVIIHGSRDSLGCLREISQAKLSLNVMPWFKEGFHDRIFNSMLNGAVCLTDGSMAINETFCHGENIMFFDLQTLRDYERYGVECDSVSKLITAIKELLKNNERLQAIADAGYEKCSNTHTWRERAKDIAKVF